MTQTDEEKARVTNAALRSWAEGYRRVQEFWGKPWRQPFTDAEIREAELAAARAEGRRQGIACSAEVARDIPLLARAGHDAHTAVSVARAEIVAAIEAKAKEAQNG